LSRRAKIKKRPKDIVDQVQTNLSSKIEQSGCKINMLFKDYSISARKSPLEMLFQNLISNAIKYKRHNVSLVIDINYDEGTHVISIKDNGVGIPSEMHRKIFKPFFKIPNENVISTGIGLATCKKIAESFGGKIWLESEVGKGR